MKVTPVSGAPTIQQPSNSGLSPEKIERLKTIARGGEPEEPKEKVSLGERTTNATHSIKMNVNRTPEQSLAQAIVEKTGSDGPTPTAEGAVDTGGHAISDTGVQAKAPEVESTQQLSPQLAAIAKRDRTLQVKEREFADKMKASEEKLQRLESLSQRAQNGQALSVLEELGIPKEQLYQKLTDEILGKRSEPDFESKFDSFEKKIEERFTKRDSEQEQAVYDQISRNVGILARTRPEFRLIKESGSESDVLAMIRKEWETNKIVLDEEEACKAIETELREEAKRYSKLIGEIEPEVSVPVAQTKTAQSNFKTLTNKDSARPTMSRKQRAIAAALGQN